MKKHNSISALLKRNIAGIAPPTFNSTSEKKPENSRDEFTKALRKKKKYG